VSLKTLYNRLGAYENEDAEPGTGASAADPSTGTDN
jgi:hypothetical protein